MKIHLMGVCGTAMASLAGLLTSQGHDVSGSDLNFYPPMSDLLERLQIKLFKGYQKENLDSKPDLVIVGNVIRRDYEEAQALLQSGIPYLSLPQALQKFVMVGTRNYVMAGTHGKTTTTSLMAYALDQLGLEPGFLVGGIPKDFDSSFRLPKAGAVNTPFVIEGDEYDTAFFEKTPKFLHYNPFAATITSIEFDHADIYQNLDQILEAFFKLIQIIPFDRSGYLVFNVHDQNIQRLVDRASQHLPKGAFRALSYGIGQGDYFAAGIRQQSRGSTFEFWKKGDPHPISEVELPLEGEHNVLNALSVLVHLTQMEGVDLKKLSGLFRSFQGVKRRLESLGTHGGVEIFEDFAHHPTAVKVTLEALLKKLPPESKLFAVFEPRSATSRTQVFQEAYPAAFRVMEGRGEVSLFRPFGETTANSLNVEQMARELQPQIPAKAYQDIESLILDLRSRARDGDKVVVMSNGDFQGIYKKMVSAFQTRAF